MSAPPRLSRSRRLLSAAASVLLVVQVALSLAPLAEARHGRSAAAHVESGDTARHYAHNDGTCASCQARTLHGLAVRAEAPLAVRALHSSAVPGASERILAPDSFSPSSPRAPPVG